MQMQHTPQSQCKHTESLDTALCLVLQSTCFATSPVIKSCSVVLAALASASKLALSTWLCKADICPEIESCALRRTSTFASTADSCSVTFSAVCSSRRPEVPDVVAAMSADAAPDAAAASLIVKN
jgi:hypothetical protein